MSEKKQDNLGADLETGEEIVLPTPEYVARTVAMVLRQLSHGGGSGPSTTNPGSDAHSAKSPAKRSSVDTDDGVAKKIRASARSPHGPRQLKPSPKHHEEAKPIVGLEKAMDSTYTNSGCMLHCNACKICNGQYASAMMHIETVTSMNDNWPAPNSLTTGCHSKPIGKVRLYTSGYLHGWSCVTRPSGTAGIRGETDDFWYIDPTLEYRMRGEVAAHEFLEKLNQRWTPSQAYSALKSKHTVEKVTLAWVFGMVQP